MYVRVCMYVCMYGSNFLTQPDPTQYPTDLTQPDPRYFGTDTTRPDPKVVLYSLFQDVDYCSVSTLKLTRICGIEVNI